MLPPRGPNFGVLRLKIRVYGQKLDTLCATCADPIFPFHLLTSFFLVKNYTHFRHYRGPDFSVLRLKMHVLGHKIDTFSATRAGPI